MIRFRQWPDIITQDLPMDHDLCCHTVAMMHDGEGGAHVALTSQHASGGGRASTVL
jgi:hypothetical protein